MHILRRILSRLLCKRRVCITFTNGDSILLYGVASWEREDHPLLPGIEVFRLYDKASSPIESFRVSQVKSIKRV